MSAELEAKLDKAERLLVQIEIMAEDALTYDHGHENLARDIIAEMNEWRENA